MQNKKITKIAGKYYDLRNFVHPGGNKALSLSFGRDATILFKSYHTFVSQVKLDYFLKNYEITHLPKGYKLVPEENNVPKFQFNTDFANDLKNAVRNYFVQEKKRRNLSKLSDATKCTNQRWLLLIFLTVMKIFAMYIWLKGWIVSLLILPIINWIQMASICHDACHFALSTTPSINVVWSYVQTFFIDVTEWYYSHNISHHCYTNMVDRDIDLAIPAMRYHEAMQIDPVNKHLHQSIGILIPFSIYAVKHFIVFMRFYVTYLKNLFEGKEMFDLTRRGVQLYPAVWNHFEFTFTKIAIICIYWILPFYVFGFGFNGFIFVLVPQLLMNFLFLFNTQVTHIHSECFDVEAVEHTDWYKQQVLTSSNHGCGKWFNFIFSGGLNYQIEHHLFPSVNHCHHPYLQPIVKVICKTHKVKYKEFKGYSDAFKSYYKYISSI